MIFNRVSLIRSTLARDTRNKVTMLDSNAWWVKDVKKKKPDNGAFIIDLSKVGMPDNQHYVLVTYIWCFKFDVGIGCTYLSMLLFGVLGMCIDLRVTQF